eukprot:TRINITY_DN16711_c0_g1_i2.p1 TRINITY_DN16711_c0_g1~~TRINITY_DN16711_c0_g1_i2.p1  ORF type:complete len:228 (+),score=60.81 TRINITY_DN16711_c0_g1_i2:3-686(+)
MVTKVPKTVEVPQVQYLDNHVHVPVHQHRQVPMVQTVQNEADDAPKKPLGMMGKLKGLGASLKKKAVGLGSMLKDKLSSLMAKPPPTGPATLLDADFELKIPGKLDNHAKVKGGTMKKMKPLCADELDYLPRRYEVVVTDNDERAAELGNGADFIGKVILRGYARPGRTVQHPGDEAVSAPVAGMMENLASGIAKAKEMLNSGMSKVKNGMSAASGMLKKKSAMARF